jgi:hypothetical protein
MWEGKDPDVRSRGGSRESDIQLTMREDGFGQVHTNIGDSLPLCLVDRHGKTEPNGKLLPL